MTGPGNDNKVRSVLSALDVACPDCKAGVGEACRLPEGPPRQDRRGYYAHHEGRLDRLYETGAAHAAAKIVRDIQERSTKR